MTSVPVLLFKIRGIFFFTFKTCLCALSVVLFLSFLPILQVCIESTWLRGVNEHASDETTSLQLCRKSRAILDE